MTCKEPHLIPHDEPPKRFRKPTVDEIRLQCAKIGLPETEAETFFNYYESKGWKVGKTPMVSWPHALANWKKNWESRRFLMGKIQKTLADKELDRISAM